MSFAYPSFEDPLNLRVPFFVSIIKPSQEAKSGTKSCDKNKLDDAIWIYARMLRARLASIRGAKAARERADHLRAKRDWSGVKVWEAVAAELIPTEVPTDP